MRQRFCRMCRLFGKVAPATRSVAVVISTPHGSASAQPAGLCDACYAAVDQATTSYAVDPVQDWTAPV